MDLLFQDDAYLKSCDAEVISVGEDGIRLSRTVFYPTGGGQPGDSGVLKLESGDEIRITEARKGDSLGDVVHIVAEDDILPAVGDKVHAVLDWDRRYRHMRFHTCMHVLCSLIDGDVTGGNLAADKARLDFNLPDGPPDKIELSEKLNAVIAENHKIGTRWITDEDLDANPGLVRTMSVQPPRGAGRIRLLEIEDVDVQPCGGTHVKSTAEIGQVVISKIENKGKQNRRFIVRFAEDL